MKFTRGQEVRFNVQNGLLVGSGIWVESRWYGGGRMKTLHHIAPHPHTLKGEDDLSNHLNEQSELWVNDDEIKTLDPDMHLHTCPSKPFHVVVTTQSGERETTQASTTLPFIEDDFASAIETAQQDTDKDGIPRTVEIVQILKAVETV